MQEINYRDLVEGQNYFVEYRGPNQYKERFKAFGFEKMHEYNPEVDYDDNFFLYTDTNNRKHIKAIQNAVPKTIITKDGEDTHLWLPRVEFDFARIVTAKSSRFLNDFDFVDREEGTTFENVFPYFINDLIVTGGPSVKFYLSKNLEDTVRKHMDMHIVKYAHNNKSRVGIGRRRRTKNKQHRKKRTRKYKY
jgi:hypothetical protein